ncbi:MAG: MFS transporter [Planctomycetes bacterium]|nr:MFS transporter [Planctomycetota bacterium]
MPLETTSKRSVYGIVFLTLFIDLIGFSIIFPIFAHLVDYYSQQQSGILHWCMQLLTEGFPQASSEQITALFGGVLFGIYALLQFVMAPVWGTLSDKIGRRPILLISVAGNTLAYVLWVFAGHFIILLLSRLMAGAMSGNISTASAAVADVSEEKDRAKAMGLVGAAIGLGFIMGPAIGGLLYSYGPTIESSLEPGLLSLNPFSFIAGCAALLSVINAVLLWKKFPETLSVEMRQSAAKTTRSINIFGFFKGDFAPGVGRCNAIYLCYMILFAGMESTLVFLAKDFVSYEPGHIAALFVMIGMIGVIIQGGLIRRLVPRFGEKRLLIAGIIVQIPGYVCLSLVETTMSQTYLIIGAASMAIGSACLMPSLSSLVSRASSAQTQGRVMGVFRSVGSLGRALGPFFGAVCYFTFSPSAPYLIAAVLVLIPLCIAFLLPVPVSLEVSASED